MNLTIGQFQELYRIDKDSSMDVLDKEVRSVSVITGLTQWEVEDMPLDLFNKTVNEIATELTNYDIDLTPKKYFKVNGKRYGINYDVRKIRAGQYIELQHFGKGDIVDNLHFLLSSIVYPVGIWRKGGVNKSEQHEKIANDMLQVDFKEAYASVVFFCKIYNESIKAITDYLVEEMKGKKQPEEVRKVLQDLVSITDGFTTPERSQNLN